MITPNPVRYDLYRANHTPRLPPIYVESYAPNCGPQLYDLAVKVFKFPTESLLIFLNNHDLKKTATVSKYGAIIIKVFSDSSPADRLRAENMRFAGICENNMSNERKELKEAFGKIVERYNKLLYSNDL